MDKCQKLDSRQSFISDESIDVERQKETRKNMYSTTTNNNQSERNGITKRKHFEESKLDSQKVEKKKTRLENEERKECQLLDVNVKSVQLDLLRKRGNQNPISNEKGRYCQSNVLEKSNSLQEYEMMNVWFPNEEIRKRYGLRKGRWTKKEEEILRENMDKYLMENRIDDPKKLLFVFRNTVPEESRKLREFVKSTDFYQKLSRGLKRGLCSVYAKALNLYEEKDIVGKCSELGDN